MACILQQCHNLPHSHVHFLEVGRLWQRLLSQEMAAHLGALNKHMLRTFFLQLHKGHLNHREVKVGICSDSVSHSQVLMSPTSKLANKFWFGFHLGTRLYDILWHLSSRILLLNSFRLLTVNLCLILMIACAISWARHAGTEGRPVIAAMWFVKPKLPSLWCATLDGRKIKRSIGSM